MDNKGNVIQTICSAYDNLSKTDQRIATFILDNRLTVPTMALREIAEGCATSSPTVSRFIKRLGFDDFNDLRLSLARDEGEQTSTTSVIGRSTESVSLDRFQESLHYILTCKTAELADTVARLDEQTIVHLIERFNQAQTHPHCWCWKYAHPGRQHGVQTPPPWPARCLTRKRIRCHCFYSDHDAPGHSGCHLVLRTLAPP